MDIPVFNWGRESGTKSTDQIGPCDVLQYRAYGSFMIRLVLSLGGRLCGHRVGIADCEFLVERIIGRFIR